MIGGICTIDRLTLSVTFHIKKSWFRSHLGHQGDSRINVTYISLWIFLSFSNLLNWRSSFGLFVQYQIFLSSFLSLIRHLISERSVFRINFCCRVAASTVCSCSTNFWFLHVFCFPVFNQIGVWSDVISFMSPIFVLFGLRL